MTPDVLKKMSTILIVDDDPLMIELMEALLFSGQFAFYRASSGDEAFAVLDQHKIDLILLDIMMPEMDGFEVARRIREKDSTAEIPIVLMSALGDPEIREKGLEVGCNDFVSKSAVETSLFDTVMAHLKQPT